MYRTDLGGFKRFCSAGISKNSESRKAVEIIVKDDILPFDNWYWVEASGFIETLFKKNNGYPIPNYLASEFLRLDPTKLNLDKDGIHYVRTSGSAKVPVKKMIFGFKDKASAEKACSSIANYEDFRLNVNKLLEDDTNVDIACQIIRQIFEFHDEWQCNEMLPLWYKQIVKAVKEVKQRINAADIDSNEKRMLMAIISRANKCLTEMTKIQVKQLKI